MFSLRYARKPHGTDISFRIANLNNSKLAQSLAVGVAISSAIVAVSGSPAPLAAAEVETYSDPGNTTINKRQLSEIVSILIDGIAGYSSAEFQGLFNFGPPATYCDG